MNYKAAAIVLVILLAGLYLFSGGKEEQAKESVKVSGAWALYPLMIRWAEEYQKVNSGVSIEVSAGGAGKGMADTLSNLVEIGMISREIDPSEVDKGAFGLAVAKDAVVPTMNKDNPHASYLLSHGITRDKFKMIFVSGDLTQWGGVASDPSVTTKISVYTRSDSCGAGDVWAKYMGVKQEDIKGIGVNGDPGIAEAVSRDVNGMGYNNLGFAYDLKTGLPTGNLAIIPLDTNADGIIEDRENFYGNRADVIAAIADGRFPSPPARDLYIVTKGPPTGATRDFINWILNDGQKYIAPEGYITLKDETLAASKAKLG